MNLDRLESVWNGMKQRCRNPNDTAYARYGARGIEVHFTSWPQFRDWALENGYRQGLTIDRIDNGGHYEPSNCRWATPAEQALNTRRNVRLEVFGETKTVTEWTKDPRCVVNYATLIQRIRKMRDMTPEQMVTTPPLLNQSRLTRGQRQQVGIRVPRVKSDSCPAGHKHSESRVRNKRGDHYCKTCKGEKAKASYRANPEPAKARSRANSRKAKSS